MNSITFELQHSQIFEENIETVVAYCKLLTVVTRYGRFNINARLLFKNLISQINQSFFQLGNFTFLHFFISIISAKWQLSTFFCQNLQIEKRKINKI